MTRTFRTIVLLLIVGSLAGCGGSRVTGKYSNQDKPKPAIDK